ncbi:MAG: hypothetical protein K6E18_01195 [Lachnospiraceae bacterium]|nr:hypothetical protein [Lachnospiraceae bacterium]
MKEDNELKYSFLSEEEGETDETVDERSEQYEAVNKFFLSGQYDEKTPEEKKVVIKAYVMFLNSMINYTFPNFESVQQNVQAFTETPFFDEFADKLIRSDLKGEDLQDRFLSVQTKQEIDYQPVNQQRKEKYANDISRLQQRQNKKQTGAIKL